MMIEKKEHPNFYGMFSQNLPISGTFTAVLKITLLQCDVIRVRAPPEASRISLMYVEIYSSTQKTSRCCLKING